MLTTARYEPAVREFESLKPVPASSEDLQYDTVSSSSSPRQQKRPCLSSGAEEPAGMNLNSKSWSALLYAMMEGEADLNSFERLFEQATNLAAAKGISRILVDGRLLTGDLSTADRRELAVKGTEHLAQLGTKLNIAFVGHPPTFNGLGALGGRELGAPDFRLFPGISEALAWLASDT